MERDTGLQDGLRRSNDRFVAVMNRILERYNHPFEDDLLVSMHTLTYDTPDGPKPWGEVSRKDKKWKNMFKQNRQSQRNTGKSKQQSSVSEDEHSTVHEESSENSGVDTSDTDEQSDTVSVRRKFKDLHLQNLNADDGAIQKERKGQMTVVVEDDERNIPKWNSTVDDGAIQKERNVQVEVIVHDDERNIAQWIMITPPSLLKSHRSISPVQELIGNQAPVCRKKLDLSNECSSSKYLQLQHSGVPISSNTINTPSHQPCPELSETLCDTICGGYQSTDEECFGSNVTLADLYPAMVEMLTRHVTKRCQGRVLKYFFGHLRCKRTHSRRLKLNVTIDKTRGFRPCKLKEAFHSICSYSSEDKQNPNSENESREFCYDSCVISNSSDLAPHAYTDTDEIKMNYSDSSLEQPLASGKGQTVSKHTAFPDVMARMGETFLGEEELQTTASPKKSEYTESEKLACKHFSEYSCITLGASSDSRALHLAKESKTQKTDFSCVGTSELSSSACSSHGNNNNSGPITNCFPARSSTTVFIYPEKLILERQTSFQHKHPFFPWFVKQSPSKTPCKYKDAFEELYDKVCSKEFQKSLTFTRPLLNSQNPEEKERLVKSNSSGFVKSAKEVDLEFDRLYDKACSELSPKFPGYRRASNLRKYEGIQMPQTVNALVNSPVRASSSFGIKRPGNFQNYLLCSPVKRLKHVPEGDVSSRTCQEISHRKEHFGYHDSSAKTFPGIPGNSVQGCTED